MYIHHVGPKTTDWKPGDIAECIIPENSRWQPDGIGPRSGERLMVKEVAYEQIMGEVLSGFGLYFIGPYPDSYFIGAFRKVTLTDLGHDRKVTQKEPVNV